MTPLKTEVESVVWDHTKIFCPFPSSQTGSFLIQGILIVQETLFRLNFTGIFFPDSLVADLCCETHNSWSLPHKLNFEYKAVPLTSRKLDITVWFVFGDFLVSVIWCNMLKSEYKMLINVWYFCALWLHCFF